MNSSSSMLIRISSLLCILVSSMVFRAQDAASSTTCSFQSPFGEFFTIPRGINDSGAVVGLSAGVRELNHALLFFRGKRTLFRFPGSPNTSANDINKYSQIVGAYDGAYPDVSTHGFVVRNGVFQAIDFPGAASTGASGINSSGDIVGSYQTGGAIQPGHAFLLHQGRFVSFSFPGAFYGTVASGINDHAVIVGTYTDDEMHTHGFRVKHGAFETIDFPGATDTALSKVNNAGDIVGSYSSSDASHGFVLANGKFISIDHPDAQGRTAGTFILGMNNLKKVVGYVASTSGEVFFGFVADCEGVL